MHSQFGVIIIYKNTRHPARKQKQEAQHDSKSLISKWGPAGCLPHWRVRERPRDRDLWWFRQREKETCRGRDDEAKKAQTQWLRGSGSSCPHAPCLAEVLSWWQWQFLALSSTCSPDPSALRLALARPGPHPGTFISGVLVQTPHKKSASEKPCLVKPTHPVAQLGNVQFLSVTLVPPNFCFSAGCTWGEFTRHLLPYAHIGNVRRVRARRIKKRKPHRDGSVGRSLVSGTHSWNDGHLPAPLQPLEPRLR